MGEPEADVPAHQAKAGGIESLVEGLCSLSFKSDIGTMKSATVASPLSVHISGLDDINRTGNKSGGDSGYCSARQVAFEPVNKVARGDKTILDRVVDDCFCDVDDAVATNVREGSSVKSVHHSLISADGLVGVPHPVVHFLTASCLHSHLDHISRLGHQDCQGACSNTSSNPTPHKTKSASLPRIVDIHSLHRFVRSNPDGRESHLPLQAGHNPTVQGGRPLVPHYRDQSSQLCCIQRKSDHIGDTGGNT